MVKPDVELTPPVKIPKYEAPPVDPDLAAGLELNDKDEPAMRAYKIKTKGIVENAQVQDWINKIKGFSAAAKSVVVSV